MELFITNKIDLENEAHDGGAEITYHMKEPGAEIEVRFFHYDTRRIMMLTASELERIYKGYKAALAAYAATQNQQAAESIINEDWIVV